MHACTIRDMHDVWLTDLAFAHLAWQSSIHTLLYAMFMDIMLSREDSDIRGYNVTSKLEKI